MRRAQRGPRRRGAGAPACARGAGAAGGAAAGAGTVARLSCAPPGDGCRFRRVAAGPEDPWPTSTAPPPSDGAAACDATVAPTAGSAVTGAPAAAAAAEGADVAASAPPPSVWMTRIGVPTLTVLPSSTSSSDTTPSNALGSSTSDFAVSISTNTWSSAMRSPGATRHCTISASVSPSPTSGNGNRISLISRLSRVAAAAAGQYASARSTASSTRSGLGRYSVSSAAGGNGVSKLDTRSTGASSE